MHWNQYFEHDPEGAKDLLYQKDDLSFRDGDSQTARTLLELLLEKDPEYTRAHYTLGLVYLQIGNHDLSRYHLVQFIALACPDSSGFSDPHCETAMEILKYI